MSTDIAVVYNPLANKGRAEKDIGPIIESIKKHVGSNVFVLPTRKPGDGIERGREAIRNGARIVIAAGGDGTLNEVLNGIVVDGKPRATFGIIPIGTGCDFARHVGIDESNYLQTILDMQTVDIDIIESESTYHLDDGTTEMRKRYTLNEVSFGLSGNIIKDLNSRKRYFLSKQGFYNYYSLINLLFMKNKEVILELKDGNSPEERRRTINQAVTVCGNGSYFGCGMRVCPHSDVTSGKLAISYSENASRWDIISALNSSRKANINALKSHKCIVMKKSSEIWANPRNSNELIFVETDGEPHGVLPIHVKKIHRCLRLIAPRSFINRISEAGIPIHVEAKEEKSEEHTNANDNIPTPSASPKSSSISTSKFDSNKPGNRSSLENSHKNSTPARGNMTSEKKTPEKEIVRPQPSSQPTSQPSSQTSSQTPSRPTSQSSSQLSSQVSSQASSQNNSNQSTPEKSELKVCSSCKLSKPSTEYTNSQLKKKEQRKCKSCVKN